MISKDVFRMILADKRLGAVAFYFFAAGFVPWYAIERLFQSEVLGLTPVLVVWTINAAIAFNIIFELPSSIWADRWSRSKILAISITFACLAGIIGGISTGFWVYVVAMIFWAAASSLHSGTVDALTYDILYEKKQTKLYPKVTALYSQIFAVALIFGSATSGFMSQWWGYRATYFAVLFLMPIGALVMYRFKEPTFHKPKQASSQLKHLHQSFKTMLSRSEIIWIAMTVVAINFMIAVPLFEFLSYLLAEKGYGLIELGITRSLITNGMIFLLSGLIATFYKKARLFFVPVLLLSAFTLFGAIYVNNLWLFAVLFAIAFTAQRAASQWLYAAVQHYFPSSERATTTSIIAWLGGVAWLITSYFASRALIIGTDQVYLLVVKIIALVALISAIFLYILFRNNLVFIEEHTDPNNELSVSLEQKG